MCTVEDRWETVNRKGNSGFIRQLVRVCSSRLFPVSVQSSAFVLCSNEVWITSFPCPLPNLPVSSTIDGKRESSLLKVVQLVQTLAPGQILIVQYTEWHGPVTRSLKSDCRGFQIWFYRWCMTYRLFFSSHLWLEFAHTPEAYRNTGRAKLSRDVRWLPRGWAVWNHPNHNTLSLHIYLLSPWITGKPTALRVPGTTCSTTQGFLQKLTLFSSI